MVLTLPTRQRNGLAIRAFTPVTNETESLPARRCLQIYRLMVQTRTLEDRLITMCKSGEGYFWVGGPGEEAFNVCLGLQVKKGCGPAYDYLHLHYRSSGTLMAMGMLPIDAIRQMAMTATDPHSRGRNFVAHYARRDWNIVPVTSVIANQFATAPGTALVQKRHGGDGITIVVGGDAGTAQGDFASCMVWSTRPANELPVLMIVTNNGWGISTPAHSQHGERRIIDRGKTFGIPGEVMDGTDAIASWHAIQRAMDYCRRERRPYLLEARVSRLYGHTSASGARRVEEEADCIELFEENLMEAGLVEPMSIAQIRESAEAEVEAAAEQARREPQPTCQDLYTNTYGPSPVDEVYPNDYVGLPE
jgi:2-oxoisovalerate dehydrogenase E1 component alpha subunit